MQRSGRDKLFILLMTSGAGVAHSVPFRFSAMLITGNKK